MRSIKGNQSSRVNHQVPNNPQADLQLTGGKSLDDKAIDDAKKKTLYDNIGRVPWSGVKPEVCDLIRSW